MDGRNTGRMGFSHAAEDSAENMMAAVKAGKIRKHLMGNTSPIRYGTMEKREMRSEERRVGKECRSRWSPYH